MPGTPAYEGGVLAGDVILKIDGKSTEQMRLSEAVDMIQGDPGQPISLTVRHEGVAEPVDLTIVRAKIKVPSVLGDQRKPDDPSKWDYVYERRTRSAISALPTSARRRPRRPRRPSRTLEKQGVRGLVIDLRNNPGGLLRSAVEICDLFLEDGVIVSTKGRNHKDEVWTAKPEGTLLLPAEKHPIAVLVNKYSASASEIVGRACRTTTGRRSSANAATARAASRTSS